VRLKFAFAIAAAFMTLGASAPQQTGVDVSGAVGFSDVKNCVYSRNTEAIFKAMLTQVGESRRWTTAPKISLGALSAATTRTMTKKDDVEPGGRLYEVTAKLPPGTLWHGLRLIEIYRLQTDYTEVDNFEERQLIFLDPPEKVQAAIKGLGVIVPFSPKYREVGDVGAMSIARQKIGASLGCNWGA